MHFLSWLSKYRSQTIDAGDLSGGWNEKEEDDSSPYCGLLWEYAYREPLELV